MVELIRERLNDEHGFVLDGFPRPCPRPRRSTPCSRRSASRSTPCCCSRWATRSRSNGCSSVRAEEGRSDDAPDVIRNRLRLYHGLTEPVVDRYRENGTLAAVNGARPVEDVAAAIEDELSRAVGPPGP